MRTRPLPPLLALALAFAPLFSVAPTAASQAPARRIILHMPSEPLTLDWNLSNHANDRFVIQNLQETLLDGNQGNELQPLLAHEWNISADGKTYTFFLRHDVRWSDGKPLVAQHFVDSLKRLISPLSSNGNGYFLLDVVGAEDYLRGRESDFSKVGIKAIGDFTLEIRLKKPLWNWIWNFSRRVTAPIRQDLIDRHGPQFWTAPGNLATVGPFVLVSHDVGTGYLLRRNSFYWGETGNIGEIEYRISPNSDAIAAFTQGKIDLICSVSGSDKIPSSAMRELRWTPPHTTIRLDYDVKRFPLTLPEVRKAIALAIDRTKLARGLGPGAFVATSAAPPAMAAHTPSSRLKFDVSRAKAALRSAELNGLSLELLVPAFDEHADENMKTAEMIQQMLDENLHVQVSIQKAETDRQYTLLRDTQQYSLLLSEWSGTRDADGFYSFYSSRSGRFSTWSDQEYDRLLEQSRSEKDAAKRLALYRKLDRMLVEEKFAVTPLAYQADAVLMGPRVREAALAEKFEETPCLAKDLDLR